MSNPESLKPFPVFFAEGCNRIRLGPLGIVLTRPLEVPDPQNPTRMIQPPIELRDRKVIKFVLRHPTTLRFNPQLAVEYGWLNANELAGLGYDVTKVVRNEEGRPVIDPATRLPMTEVVVPGQLRDDERLPPGTPDLPVMSIVELREIADDFVDAEGKKAPVHLPTKAGKDEIVEILTDAYVQKDKAISARVAAVKAAGVPTDEKPSPKGGKK